MHNLDATTCIHVLCKTYIGIVVKHQQEYICNLQQRCDMYCMCVANAFCEVSLEDESLGSGK